MIKTHQQLLVLYLRSTTIRLINPSTPFCWVIQVFSRLVGGTLGEEEGAELGEHGAGIIDRQQSYLGAGGRDFSRRRGRFH